MMQTNSTTLLNSNNNNNNNASTKNLQVASASPSAGTILTTTDGGQFIFKSAAAPSATTNHIGSGGGGDPSGNSSSGAQLVQVSMSPGLGGGGTGAASAGLVTMTKTLNQGTTTGQNIVGTPTMLPAGVQIVNMRTAGAPTGTIQQATGTVVQQATQQGQRTVATVQPRVVIGSPHVMTTTNRPATNSLQLTQGVGPTLLLKTESGQFQLLRVGTAPAGQPGAGGVQHATLTTTSGQQSIVTTGAGGNQTIRLQTMPASTATTNIVLTSSAATPGSQSATLITASAPQTMVTSVGGGAPPVASVPPVPAAVASTTGQTTTTVVVTTTPQAQTNQQNTKEKCRKFLANLLDLSSREPKSVEKNVRTLIQELIDNAVEPEGFCNRLERLLNASPQPCLIGFLKKSLPVLRQSLVRKELTIDGIRPPPQTVAFPNATISTIPATVRQTIIPRMVSPAAPRAGQTTITRHTTPVRIQGMGQGPRHTTINQIRPGAAVPALQPVSGLSLRAQQPGTVQIRAGTTTAGGALIRPAGMAANITKVSAGGGTAIKVGQAQIKQISGTQLAGNTIGGNQMILNRTPGITTITQKHVVPGTTLLNTGGGTTVIGGSAAATAAQREKDRKASSFYQHNSISSSIYGDDEINDVAAMGGVNLAEESQRILGSTELIGTQIRSCKDEVFLHLPALQSKIRQIVARHGLEEPNADVAVLISHAVQERLKNIVEKLAVIAEHRVDVIKIDPRYAVTQDVRGQIKFLEELDRAEHKRHEEQEREMLLRAAKSRTKNEDPEQAKLKAKAKEMQRAEMEELRQRDANLTALQAIGQRKKPRLDGDAATTTTAGSAGASSGTGLATATMRPRLKRVNLRDMVFYLEQERETCRSPMLYRAYLK